MKIATAWIQFSCKVVAQPMSVRSANLNTSFRNKTVIVNWDILIIDFESSSTSSQHCWSESFSWLQQHLRGHQPMS